MFEDEKWENKLRSTVTYLELKEIFELFGQHNYAIIKGEPLSIYAYNSCGCRKSSDIDILVPRSDINIWEKALSKKLKRMHTEQNERADKVFRLALSHQLAPYVNEAQTFAVDLNFDLFWGEYDGQRIDVNEFLSDSVEMEIYGTIVKTLSPLKMLIQLALHHYKDMNSLYLLATRKRMQYSMFEDIYYLLKNNSKDITIQNVYDISNRYNVLPYVFYILYYTNQVFPDNRLNQFVQATETLEGKELLGYYGLASQERKKWKIDFEERLCTEDMFELIQSELTPADLRKIEINKKYFGK